MNDFIPSRSPFSEEDRYEIRLSNLIVHYNKMQNNEKRTILNSIEIYNGNNFQCARFLCWMLEDDQSLRKKVLKQWLNIQKVNGTLPPIGKIMPRLIEVTSFDMNIERRNQRIREFIDTYESLHETKRYLKRGKNYMSDLTNQHESEIIQPLIDPKEPMCLTVFSPNMEKVSRSLEQCAHLNIIETTNADGVVTSGYLRSSTIYDAIMRIGNGLNYAKE